MHRGYFKVWRKFIDNPRFGDPEFLALWIWILRLANHKPTRAIFKGKSILLDPGQFITGRKFLSKISGVNEFKIERIIKLMIFEQQIEQQTSNANRLITILNWDKYHSDEQQNAQPVHNECTTSAQPVHTLKNVKNEEERKEEIHKKGFSIPEISEIRDYCLERKNTVNPDLFYDHYESNGWMIGKAKMKNWKAAIRTWEKNQKGGRDGNKNAAGWKSEYFG